MADKTVGELPQVSELYDDSLLVAEQQGGAVSVPGSVLKKYAKQGVDELVAQARAAAAAAEKAAQDAEDAASKIQDVSDDVAAAVAAAQAAEDARAAAVAAQQSAEQAAALAAQQAAANVESKLQGYVSDAEKAKTDAQAAAENAANQAAQGVEDKLAGYVSDAEKAKTDAQSAAGTAATDAVNSVNTQLAQHVSDAQAAQRAAEQARDEAQAIAGGNFLPLAGGTMTGALTLAGDPTADLHAVPKRYVDDNFMSNSTPVPIAKGGTNAASAEDARTNLGVYSTSETDAAIKAMGDTKAPAILYGTEDLEDGVSPLAVGTLYVVIE